MGNASRSGSGDDPTDAATAVRTVLAVACGDEQFSSLDDRERLVAHAVIDQRISSRAATEYFGEPAPAADLGS